MAVLKIENSKVTFVWMDVNTLVELKVKYGLEGPEYRVGNAVPGQIITEAGEFVTPETTVDLETLANDIRAKRNRLLASSDWTQLEDIPVEIRDLWKAYRQDLRDITSQEGFPENVEWPISPNSQTITNV
jgi:hypothetical protein